MDLDKLPEELMQMLYDRVIPILPMYKRIALDEARTTMQLMYEDDGFFWMTSDGAAGGHSSVTFTHDREYPGQWLLDAVWRHGELVSSSFSPKFFTWKQALWLIAVFHNGRVGQRMTGRSQPSLKMTEQRMVPSGWSGVASASLMGGIGLVPAHATVSDLGKLCEKMLDSEA